MSKLSDPVAVQKLVRHFSQNTGVIVHLDYSDKVVPSTSRQTDGSAKVTIPAWMKADDLPRLLGACLHESGHVEYDLPGMRELDAALRGGEMPGWGQYLHNVVTDARIDARRCAAFAGARSLYAESWRMADAAHKEAAGKRTMADAESLRVHVTCLGALSAALGFDADTPWIAAGPFAAHPKRDEIIALLRSCAAQNGTLLPEALRLLALLALDPSLVPPSPAPPPTNAPQSGAGAPEGVSGEESTPGPLVGGAGPSTSGPKKPADDPSGVDAFARDTSRLCKGRALKRTLAKRDFQEHMRAAANRVFRGQTFRKKVESGGQVAPLFHTSPCSFDATTPFGKAELAAARSEFIGDAIRAFVASTRDVPGDDDYRYRIDARRLPGIVTDPTSILIGDTTAALPNCAVDLVLDVSGSMQSPIAADGSGRLSRMSALLLAVRTWVDSADTLGASGVKIGVRLFATSTARHLDFTELSGIDRGAFTGRAIERTSTRKGVGGGTNCRLGLEESIRDLSQESARRKAIILITDGAIFEDDYKWIAREWPDGVALAILAVSNDATGMCGTTEDLFKFRALTEPEVTPMLASAMRDAVERQTARG